MSITSVSELAKSIDSAAEKGIKDISEEDRKQLLQACSKLQSSFELPFEYTLRVIFSVLGISCGPFYIVKCQY
jgi:hypothetical protein